MTRSLLRSSVLLLATFITSAVHAQSMRMLTPNGGEIWREGEMHDITWTTSGETGNVALYLEVTNTQGVTQEIEISKIATSAGTLAWFVPNLGSEPLQARILIDGDITEDGSDTPFTILPKNSLSVRSTKPNTDFSLRGFYPNPAIDVATFTWDPAGKSAVIATLYNSAGSVVQTTSVNASSNELRLDVHDLPQGSYFYELRTEGHIARGVLTIKR